MSGGLLIGGKLYQVPGVTVIGPHEATWAHLSAGDGRKRRGRVQMGILHTTKGIHPQRILPGKGPAGRAERVAKFWESDPAYSGAQIVVGSDGVAACLADLATFAAYHATVSNDLSWGLEIYQEPGGVIYQAALDTTVAICKVAARAMMIPKQFHRGPYTGGPLTRMLNGGKDCYGFFGHRDNTDRRGRGDPGDQIFLELARAGFEALDIVAGEDLAIWKKRQALLNAAGAGLVVDGLPGPGTMTALRTRGFADGVDFLPAD